ncbi:MAG: hypothetical protein HYU68_11645 [Bacteroidetes bacterium]|nr:hypothetical protein [Bacteroidota bacterium]
MKKRLLFVAAIFAATATFAQDGLTSKKGEAYLPEAGDWSIGFNANSLLMYVGNAANGTIGSNSLTAPWMADNIDQELRAKMFKDEKTAYRLRFRIGTGSTSSDSLGKYNQDADLTTPDVDFTRTTKESDGFSLIIGGGLEKRRGNTRIQGYYGGELYIALLGGKTTEYSDSRTLNDDYTGGATTEGSARTTKDANGGTFKLGLGGFVGVEWFFAPKVSLGAEYGWGLAMSSTSEGEKTSEYWGIPVGSSATSSSLQTVTSKTGKSSEFTFDTDNMSANINLNFHF